MERPIFSVPFSLEQDHSRSALRAYLIVRLLANSYKKESLDKKYGGTLQDLLLRFTTSTESDNNISSQHILADLLCQLNVHAEDYDEHIQTA